MLKIKFYSEVLKTACPKSFAWTIIRDLGVLSRNLFGRSRILASRYRKLSGLSLRCKTERLSEK